jgi:hypothetical protein
VSAKTNSLVRAIGARGARALGVKVGAVYLYRGLRLGNRAYQKPLAFRPLWTAVPDHQKTNKQSQ